MATNSSVALRVQRMTASDTAVTLARLATERSTDGQFGPKDLDDIYVEAGIPMPSKASNQVASLRRLEFVRPGSRSGSWKLTPAGRARTDELLSAMDFAGLEAEARHSNGSLLGGTVHSVVPPTLAPPSVLLPLRSFLEKHPFETNVFGMTRFPVAEANSKDPVTKCLEVTRAACAAHGLTFHLASDRAIADDLWANVAAHMWACHYGIAFFEDRMKRGMNYNLTIEVGSMLMTGRRCALLKDDSIDKMPTDLVGQIYQPVDLDDLDAVSRAVHGWIRDDLALGKCSSCTV